MLLLVCEKYESYFKYPKHTMLGSGFPASIFHRESLADQLSDWRLAGASTAAAAAAL